jgi:hypothetical protein
MLRRRKKLEFQSERCDLSCYRAMRTALENKGFEEVPEQDLDTAHFDVRWTLTHDDINFSTLLPPQIVNHYPNSGTELGAKVRVWGSRFRVRRKG